MAGQEDRDNFLTTALEGYKHCLVIGDKYDVRVVCIHDLVLFSFQIDVKFASFEFAWYSKKPGKACLYMSPSVNLEWTSILLSFFELSFKVKASMLAIALIPVLPQYCR